MRQFSHPDRSAPSDLGSDDAAPEAELDLVELYHSDLKRLEASLRRNFGDGPPDPEDIAQQSFQKLIEVSDRSRIQNLEAYLWRTARNLMLQGKRSLRTRLSRDYEVEHIYFPSEGVEIEPERIVSAKEQIALINTVLLQMPERRRRAFALHRIEGLSISEVARRLGVSRTAIHKHVARASAQIDLALQEGGKP